MGAQLFHRKASRAPRIYLDMDGVMADYWRGAVAAGVSPDQFKDVPGAYRNLDWMPGAEEAFRRLMENYGDRLYILSSPPSGRVGEATEEKRQWLAERCPDFPLERAIFTTDKALEGIPGDVLLDDHPEWNGAKNFPGTVIPYTGPASFEILLSDPGGRTAATLDLTPLVQEFSAFLDPEGRFPLPTAKLVSRVGAEWLGRCVPLRTYLSQDRATVTHTTSEIQIQKGITGNHALLRSVVAHEVGHHIAWNEILAGTAYPEEAALASKAEGQHGPQFMDVVERLNAHYGANFVTVTCDTMTNEFEASREVFLFVVQPHGHPIPTWCWDHRVPETILGPMRDLNSAGEAKVFLGKTRNRFLVVPGAKGAGHWTTPKYEHELQALQEAMESQPSLWADYASGAIPAAAPREKRWTLVMADPHRAEDPSGVPRWINAWAIARTLTPKEQDLLSKVDELGIRVCWTKVVGHAEVFKVLPKFDINLVAYRPGLASNAIHAQDVQSFLAEQWPQAETPHPKVATTLRALTAHSVYVDEGEGTSAMVRAEIENHLGPNFLILVSPDPSGNLEAEIHVTAQGLPENHGGKPFLLHTSFRDTDLATASDLILQIREVIQQEYEELAYPLRKAQQRKKLHDLQAEARLAYQKVMADLIPQLTRRPAPKWNGWTGPKQAGAWDAETTRMHYREDAARVRQVQTTLRQRFQQLLDGLYVQPEGRAMTLRQFLQRNPLTELFRSTDQSVRLMGNRVRQEMDRLLHQEFTPADIQQFKDTYGSNVTEWFTHKVIARSTISAYAALKTARLSDDALLKRYQIKPEQLALAKAVDGGDYLEWVVKQMVGVKPKRPNLTYEEANAKNPTVRLPEDTEKLQDLLGTFTKLKRSPKFTGSKDINAYTPGDLFTLQSQAAGQVSEKEQRRDRYAAAVVWSGRAEHKDLGQVDVEVLKVADPQAAMEISGGPGLTQDGTGTPNTNWCTTQEDYATRYTKDGQVLWVVKVEGRNYAQFHAESDQLLDVKDEDFPHMNFPRTGVVILDSVVNEALGRSGAYKAGGSYVYLDLATAPPEALVRYYGALDAEIPDEAMAKILHEPKALALLLTTFDYEETPEDFDVLFTDLEATALWAQKWLARPGVAAKLDTGEVFVLKGDPALGKLIAQKLHEAVTLIAQNPFQAEKFVITTLALRNVRQAWGDKIPAPEAQPKWFQGLVAAVKSDPGALARLAEMYPQWPGLPETLLAKSYTLALRWFVGRRPAKPWPALEEAILGHENQKAACEYLRWFSFTTRGVAAEDPLFNLALSKVPEDDETHWAVAALLTDRIKDYAKTVYPKTPFPEDWSGKLFPAATDQIVWQSKNPHLLALWAAKVYQHDAVKLRAALEHLAGNGQAAVTYLEAANFPKTPLLEPGLLDLLKGGGSIWFTDVMKYVTRNYAPDLKSRGDVLRILQQAVAERQPTALSAAARPR